MNEEVSREHKIRRLLESVSLALFVKYFYSFRSNKDNPSNKDLLELFKKNSEKWTHKACVTRASKGKKIFSEKLEVDALNYIIDKAKRVDESVREEARNLFKNYTLIISLEDLSNSLTANHKSFTSDDIYTDAEIRSIEKITSLTTEEKRALVKIRFGQSLYRKRLIDFWGGCSISGCLNQNVLIASHIKPYYNCDMYDRYDVFNGLLLTPNYDILFDKYLISFDEYGKILISKNISNFDLEKLGITINDRIQQDKLTVKHFDYLKDHRIIFHTKEGND